MSVETNCSEFLRKRLSSEHFRKLENIKNKKVLQFIAKNIELLNPDDVYVCDASEKDEEYLRKVALEHHEEAKLRLEGHTVHFDGYYDQARDKKRTKFLVTKDMRLGEEFNKIDRDAGLREVKSLLRNSMVGRQLIIKFFSLGPLNSVFSIPSVQLTDSAYVAHSESILYRNGYALFTNPKFSSADFFKFVHSQGELQEGPLGLFVSKNVDKRRIYIDLKDETVYSVNTQYGGNTMGLKKLAMRLAIRRAVYSGWLTEHMFIMGVHGPNGRISYFTGAYPSMCGKTSTAMVVGEKIVGDDIAYIRNIDGIARAVNVEKGMFGILTGVNSKDDPIIWKVLHSPNEIIFSNVLVTDDRNVYWIGKDAPMPERGVNFSGEWYKGKKDENGNEIPPAHKNARFTVEMKVLENIDPKIDDPNGVEVSGIIYGGRDSDTWVPVEEAFDWVHGIITKGASLESETTAATLGKEGERVFNPMSNLDFLSVPISDYIKANIDFGLKLKRTPKIFSVNYFLRGVDGKYKTGKNDKRVWLKWMERRVHNDVSAIKTPTGYIPYYQDLKNLFEEVLNVKYTEESYVRQFSVRVKENLKKIDRILKIYEIKVLNTPQILFKILEEQKERLEKVREKYGEHVPPFVIECE